MFWIGNWLLLTSGEVMAKSALITGVTGQDGAYLADFLLKKNYKVFGTFRRLSTPNFWRLQYLKLSDKLALIPADLMDTSSIIEAIHLSEPDEIYNLAAQSHVGASFEQPVGTTEITGIGATRILEAIRHINPKIRFYQASTSELYGNSNEVPQKETTPFSPASPYAAAKLYAYWLTRMYREAYGIFAANGILFNHESPIRGMEFVTRKVTNAVARIKMGLEKHLVLGNLDSKRDWGYAPEYVEAMWLMLQQDRPEDFVIASNETHSVEELAQFAFAAVGLNWQDHVKLDKRFTRPLDVVNLQGDFSKAQKHLGWSPKTKFAKLIELMVHEDCERWQRHLKGETFPWDAPNYREEAQIITRALRS